MLVCLGRRLHQSLVVISVLKHPPRGSLNGSSALAGEIALVGTCRSWRKWTGRCCEVLPQCVVEASRPRNTTRGLSERPRTTHPPGVPPRNRCRSEPYQRRLGAGFGVSLPSISRARSFSVSGRRVGQPLGASVELARLSIAGQNPWSRVNVNAKGRQNKLAEAHVLDSPGRGTFSSPALASTRDSLPQSRASASLVFACATRQGTSIAQYGYFAGGRDQFRSRPQMV